MDEKELLQAIEDLEKQEWKLREQRYVLESQLKQLRINALISSDFLTDESWEYRYNKNTRINLWRMGEVYPESLKSLFSWDHDTTDLNDKIELGWSDGQVYLRGELSDIKSFVLKYGLQVDFSELKADLEEKQKDLELRKDILAKWEL